MDRFAKESWLGKRSGEDGIRREEEEYEYE
jgi:hypothetical protein